MAQYSAYQVTNWFLAWTDDDPEILITNLKMQKLLYYAQAHYLANTNEPLFQNAIEAWDKGPVVPDIYYKYSENSKLIYKLTHKHPPLELDEDFDFNQFTHYDNQFLIQIWETYGKYDAEDLVDMTHQEKPWIENYYLEKDAKKVISQKEMKQAFSASLVAA